MLLLAVMAATASIACFVTGDAGGAAGLFAASVSRLCRGFSARLLADVFAGDVLLLCAPLIVRALMSRPESVEDKENVPPGPGVALKYAVFTAGPNFADSEESAGRLGDEV